MDLVQQNLNVPRVNANIILVVGGKFEKIGSYNSPSLAPLPIVGDEIQVPKIPQDKSEGEETVCEVVKIRHHLPLGKMFFPVVSLFVSLDCSWEP